MQDPELGSYRGFLFADLRGYSAFVESHGDRAGADLLRAYRDLVREQVTRFHGGEIRTEGDSFYLVFPSASSAVRCGLAILEAAGASTAAAGGPIRVGIGVHAGETTETDEGFVGSAVNIAARVCSVARPGELLVTETVQSLIRTQLPLRFVPRGTHRLKGIREAIALFRVEATAGAAGIAARRDLPDWLRRQPALLGVTAAAAVALVIGVAVVSAFVADRDANSPEAPVARSPATASAAPASATPSADDEFPNAAEQVLLAAIDPDLRPRCRRADPEDVPTYQVADLSRRIPMQAGLRCTVEGPTVVLIWQATETGGIGAPRSDIDPEGFFQQIVNRYTIPEGDCATTDEAHGRWQFGDRGGRVLCRRSGERAILVWTYDRTTLIGVASRTDGDHAALYEWWLDHGRTLTGL